MVDSRWRNGNKTRQDAAAQLLLPQTHTHEERAGGALFSFSYFIQRRGIRKEKQVLIGADDTSKQSVPP
jgi:hypothetical protein